MKVDLHVHTNYSDGNLDLLEILELALKNNIKELSITDHETIINLKNYEFLSGKYNLKLIPGIEIPTDIDGLHILGYGIEDFEFVENHMLELKRINEIQNIKTIEALKENNVRISYEMVKKQVEEEYISYRDIMKFLLSNGYVSSGREAYKKYIGEGAIAYYPSVSDSPRDVIGLIKESGGIAVLAHPFTISNGTVLEDEVNKLVKQGLDGIEMNSKHLKKEELIFLRDVIKKHKLVKTIGTDFHDYKQDKLGIEVKDNYLDDFNRKILKKQDWGK